MWSNENAVIMKKTAKIVENSCTEYTVMLQL